MKRKQNSNIHLNQNKFQVPNNNKQISRSNYISHHGPHIMNPTHDRKLLKLENIRLNYLHCTNPYQIKLTNTLTLVL